MPRDLLFQDDIRDTVAKAYRAISTGAGRPVAGQLYDEEELGTLGPSAVDWTLGVGNPVRHADLVPGEVVLDVGCGGGIDTILAAKRVAPMGWVIGLDLLDEMCRRAQEAARMAGVGGRTEFRCAQMEAIPLPDESIDVAISNGVLNLSPRKSRALAEIHRVLRAGGRLCIADLTVEDDLAPEVLTSEAGWAGCVAGALAEHIFVEKLQRAGFIDLRIDHRVPYSIDDVARYPLFTEGLIALMRELIPPERQTAVATCVIARARKP